MQDDDVVLSDVHLRHTSNEISSKSFCSRSGHVDLKESLDPSEPLVVDFGPPTTLPDLHQDVTRPDQERKVSITRYVFVWPHKERRKDRSTRGTRSGHESLSDKDGDLDIERRANHQPLPGTRVLTIRHTLATPLSLVGLQVWSGALLLCDYLLHIHQQIANKTVLELGAGTGLCSIIAAMFAGRVICTDFSDPVLHQCRKNFEKNSQLISQFHKRRPQPSFLIRRLDLTAKDPFCSKKRTGPKDAWTWTTAESNSVLEMPVLLAADVIYDNELTEGLFSFLRRLTHHPTSWQLFLTLERRLNFTLEKLDISCPAYDCFLQNLEELEKQQFEQRQIFVERLTTNFPRHFDYERTKYLELWKIACQ